MGFATQQTLETIIFYLVINILNNFENVYLYLMIVYLKMKAFFVFSILFALWIVQVQGEDTSLPRHLHFQFVSLSSLHYQNSVQFY